MATSQNLAVFSNAVPAHSATTEIAITGGLRKTIGHDAQYNNYFCLGIPFTTPADGQINSISFTLTVHSTGGHNLGEEMQSGWVAWISTKKYENTVPYGTSVYSTVTSHTPHYTNLLIPQAEGAVSRTVTFTIDKNTFNYQPNQKYYIYIWNSYKNSSKHYMWYVDDLTAIADYEPIQTHVVYIKKDNVWKKGTIFMKNNSWKQGKPYTKNGQWR